MSDESPRIQDYSPPKPGKSDHAETALAIGVTAFAGFIWPLAGAAGVEGLRAFIGSRMDRRCAEWMQTIADAMDRLDQTVRGLRARVETREEFTTAFAQALPAAMRTHHEEKRRALRNAVLHAAIDPAPNAAENATFIRYVDELEPPHLAMLAAFDQWSAALSHVDSFVDVFHIVQPTLSRGLDERDAFRATCQDLQTRHLVEIAPGLPGLGDVADMTTVTHTTKRTVRVTEVGKRFLKCIADPLVPSEQSPAER